MALRDFPLPGRHSRFAALSRVLATGNLWAWATMAWAISWIPVEALRIHGDPWWDLTIGQWELHHHAIATINLWGSHAIGVPWVNPEWLWGIILAIAAHWGYEGWLGVLALGMAAYFLGIAVLIRQWHLSPTLRSLVLLGAIIVAEGGWGFRPQVWAYACAIFGFVCVQSLHTALTQHQMARARKLAIGLLGLTVAWAQFHGSWILIPVWLSIEVAVSAELRHRVFWLGVAVVSVGLVAASQPWGWGYVMAAVQLSHNTTIAQFISEWMSPNFHQVWVLGLYGAYGLTGAWALWKIPHPTWSRLTYWRHTIYWMGFGVAACYAVRFLPYLPIGMIVAWDEWDPGDIHIVPPAVATVAAVGLAFGVLWPWAIRVLPTHPSIAQSAASGPGAALSVLAAHGYGPGTDVFANLSWGGYLEWRGYRPWIDTRDNFWSYQHHDLTAYFLAATGAVNPDHVVRRSGDQIALLKPHGPLVWGLQADHWIAIWHNADAVILIAPGTLWSVPVRHPVPILPSRLRT